MEHFFRDVLGSWSYLGLFVVLLAAGFGLPLPEDIPLIFSGFAVSQGSANLWLMILTGLAGVMMGDSALFFIGRRYGAGVLERPWFRRFARPWLVEKARDKYARHGAKILFAARFMPGLRSILFLIAGTFRVPYWKLLAFDGTAALISVPVWVLAGYYFSENIDKLIDDARLASLVVGGAFVVALVAWILWEYYHNLRRRRSNGHSAREAGPSTGQDVHIATTPSPRTDQVGSTIATGLASDTNAPAAPKAKLEPQPTRVA